MKHSLINLNILQLFAFSQRRQIVSIFLFVLLDFLPIQAQTFFYKAWIQTGSTLESGFINHIVSTTNSTGESYVAGSTLNTNGTHSMILTKYNSKGTQAWSTQFTVDVAGQVFVGGIALDASGNIIVTGSAYNGTSNNYDIFVVKYNNAGSKLWHQLRNGTANSYDFGTAVVCASNGDIFVTGGIMQSTFNMNAVILGYNSSGTTKWVNTFDGSSLIDAGGTIFLQGTNVIVTGFAQTSVSTWEYFACRFNQSDGSLLGSSVTNQGGTSIERANAATLDAAGNIYITGAMGTTSHGSDVKTVKLDPQLNILWTASWNSATNKDDVGRGIAVDASGNVYVTGFTTNSDKNGLLLKYTSSGTLSFAQTYNSSEGDDEFAGLALTSNGDVFTGGYITRKGNKDFFTALYGNGTLLWSEAYNGIYNQDDEIQYVTTDNTNNFIVSGPSIGNGLGVDSGTSSKVLTIQYNSHTLIQPQNKFVDRPFIENRGQVLNTNNAIEGDIKYYTREMYPNVYLFDNKISYVYSHIDTIPSTTDTMTRLDLEFPSNLSSRINICASLEEQDYVNNYYLGHIPEGRERVPLHNKVLRPNIYTNIDALMGQGPDGLFVRFICQPGSNPNDIKLQFSGQTGISILSNGDLKVETILEDLILPKPTASIIGTEGNEASASWTPSYLIGSDGKVSITIGNYDLTKTLVIKSGRDRGQGDFIDPYWSTYYGASNRDEVFSLDVENNNNNNPDSGNGDIYFTGTTFSANFPIFNAIQSQIFPSNDAFAGRFDYQGVRKWVTYYGGSISSENPSSNLPTKAEFGLEIVVGPYFNSFGPGNSPSGSIYFMGKTDARDFPLKQNIQNANAYFDDYFPSGNQSLDWRGFIVKLVKLDGTRQWATFFGDGGIQNNHDRQESITAAKLSSDNHLVITGIMEAGVTNRFPTLPHPPPLSSTPYTQSEGTIFIAEFNETDELIWATPLTCNGTYFKANEIAIDNQNNIYLVGQSNISNYCNNSQLPLTVTQSGAYSQSAPSNNNVDGWIMKFNQSRQLIWSTYFGGNGNDGIFGSAIDPSNNDFYIVGSTTSTDLPVMDISGPPHFFNGSNNGSSDIFIAKFSSSGIQEYTTYFGGSQDEQYEELNGQSGFDGGCTVFDGQNLIVTGTTKSSNLPVVNHVPNNVYYHPNINKGLSNTPSDGFLLVLDKNFNNNFCTYWGGEKDESSREIALGNAYGQSFVVIGGWSITNSTDFNKKIPLSKEVPASYYQIGYGGGSYDGFVSKIRLDQAVATSTIQASSNNEILVYPNPFTAQLILEVPETINNLSSLNLRVFDILGRQPEIQFEKMDGNKCYVDFSAVASGIYFISLTINGKQRTQTVIKN